MTGNSLTFDGRIRSFKFAFKGILTLVSTQRNAWIHSFATVLVILFGINFKISKLEWCFVILAIVSVWTTEALNTAFEFLTDVASPEFHPLAEKAKDVAAASVLIAAIGAVLIGWLVFSPYLLTFNSILFDLWH